MADQAGDERADPLGAARDAELLELTQDAVLVRDFRTKVMSYWNTGAERLYGWSKAEAIGRVAHELLHTRFPVSLEAVDEALLEHGFWEGNLVHRRRDGSQIVVFSRHAIQRDARGTPMAILEINSDITAEQQAEEERIRRFAEQRGRELAERGLDRLSRLHRVRNAMAETLTQPQVAALVLHEAVGGLGGAGGSVVYDAERIATLGDQDAPYAEAQPLIVDGRPIGTLTVNFAAPPNLEVDDRDLLIAFSGQCAQGLERARLYRLAQQAQEDLRRSRDQLAAILAGIAEGVTVQDAQGRLVYVNEVAARMSGFASADEFLAAPPRQVLERFAIFDEAGNPLPLEQLPGRRLLLGKPATEIVVRFSDVQTNEQRWSILDATPVRDEHGQLQLVVNIFRDITERKREADASAFLAEASNVLSSSLDAEATLSQLAQLAVRGLADTCLVHLVDDRATLREVAVAHANEDGGHRPRPSSALPDLTDAIERVMRSGGPELVEDGGSAILAPMRARGTTLGVITLATNASGRRFRPADLGLVEDLSARAGLAVDNARLFREAQEQAEHQTMLNSALRDMINERDRALADFQQSMRTRDEFLASASHDLKNPLASIKATAQLMQRRLERDGGLDLERVREGLRRLDVIASRAAEQVEELLDLARMQMGRPLDLDRRLVDLVALARDVVAEEQNTTERHTLRVESGVDRLVGAFDANRMRRLLNNLVDNAIKYSPDGGVVFLRIRVEPSDLAIIEVEDQGLGIPADEVGRIFERFQRASNVEGHIAGTGIGLASALHIVESHAGQIEVESREGVGTLFRIRLPLRAEPKTGEGGQ